MRISQYYDLEQQQSELDFVDVDVVGDVRLFVDPRALRFLSTPWGDECRYLLQHFFGKVVDAIRDGRHGDALGLLAALAEPNETHLGLSQGRARGHGMGSGLARDVWEALSGSEAVLTGLLKDLEETILLVDYIGSDIISDMTTNIIRAPLIQYTQAVCEVYGIPVREVASGPVWLPDRGEWEPRYAYLPVAEGARLLLVPKAIVRQRLDYDPGEYYRLYLLKHLQGIELSANTELVKILKSGERRVYKKDLVEKYGRGKGAAARLTLQYPECRPSAKMGHISGLR